ncbi:MAG: hypothetical protein HeimC3_39740 [Candidatus Heimdallarchaeota archaeon LC_3]|nr:MAG: hypothetical protein HeimC3_39740 [Candidatus Heimdallarchaeota archaeon LC_3]
MRLMEFIDKNFVCFRFKTLFESKELIQSIINEIRNSIKDQIEEENFSKYEKKSNIISLNLVNSNNNLQFSPRLIKLDIGISSQVDTIRGKFYYLSPKTMFLVINKQSILISRSLLYRKDLFEEIPIWDSIINDLIQMKFRLNFTFINNLIEIGNISGIFSKNSSIQYDEYDFFDKDHAEKFFLNREINKVNFNSYIHNRKINWSINHNGEIKVINRLKENDILEFLSFFSSYIEKIYNSGGSNE